MEQNREARCRTVAVTGLLILLAGYLIAFSIINFCGMARFMTGDVYEDTLVARYMWERKSIFPEGWVFGNQYYVIATPVLAALCYGLTGSMNLAMALATTIMTVLLLAAMYWALRPFLSRTLALAGLVALVSCVLVIDVQNKIEAQLLFLLASYYSCYLITLLVVWGDYVRGLFLGKPARCVSYALGLVLSFATGMQSVRQTCIMVAPLLAFEGLRMLLQLIRFRGRPPREAWRPTLRVAGVTAANLGGVVLIRLLDVPAVSIYGNLSVRPLSEMVESLRTALRATRSVTGLRYVEYYDPDWFIILFSLLSIAAVAVALWQAVVRWRRKEASGLEALMGLCVLSLAAVIASSVLLELSLRSVYLFVWYLLVCLSVVYLAGISSARWKVAVLALLCALSAANLYVSYQPGVSAALTGGGDGWQEIADYLMDKDYELLYGSWYDVSMVCANTDGAVVAGAWHEGPYQVLGYINPQDIYTPEDNGRAAYLIADGELEEARRLAEEGGAVLTLLRQFGGRGLYTSSVQLMKTS